LVALACLAAAIGLAGVGVIGLIRADRQVTTRQVVVDGLPMLVVTAGQPAAAPGVVVAHGYAASARLMRGFADTLAVRGYVVVLPDFSGHGANSTFLPTVDSEREALLDRELDVAVGYLKSRPDVNPDLMFLVGHSMGAAAVTRYAAGHSASDTGIAGTVAISLPSADGLSGAGPGNLLLLVGGAEYADFHTAAVDGLHRAYPEAGLGVTAGDLAARTARRAVVIPGTEHISILYADQTHAEVASWLDSVAAGGGPEGQGGGQSAVRSDAALHPRDRLLPASLLLLAFVIGFVPLTWWLLPRRSSTAAPAGVRGRFAYPGLLIGLVAAFFAAPYVPTRYLPLAVGNYSAGFFILTGLGLVAAWLIDGRKRAGGPPYWPGVILALYALAAITVPVHLGLLNAVPTGARWWLLPIAVASAAVLLIGAELVSTRSWWRVPLILAGGVAAVFAAGRLGYGPAFVQLVLPLLVVLYIWYAVWSWILRPTTAPPWLTGLIGAIVVAVPMAVALPLSG
jgi:dienelactone hydrolase